MAAVNLNNERIIWATWMLSKSIPISGSVKIAPSHPTDSSLYDLTPPSHHSTSHHSAHHSGVDHRGLGHVVPRHSTPHHAVIHHPATHEELAHTAHLHLLRIIPVANSRFAGLFFRGPHKCQDRHPGSSAQSRQSPKPRAA